MRSMPPPGSAAVAELGLVAAGAGDELRRVVGEVAAVRVRAVEVLGPHRGAVGRAPPERGLGRRDGHAAPHDRVLEPGEAQDLRHLRDVAEHVGQVADLHRRRRARGARAMPCCRFRTMVSPETMNSSMRIIHGPTCEPPAAGERGAARGSASGRTSR